MAERRMFAKTIIDSDAFLNMPASAQNLYFHLGMRADDDGVVNNPRSIMRLVGAHEDDMNILISRKFLIVLQDSIIVIKHWKINNYIQNDRYTPSKYAELLECLSLDENKAYTTSKNNQCIHNVSIPDTKCIQSVSTGKDSIGKDSVVLKENITKEKDEPLESKTPVLMPKDTQIALEVHDIFNYWNVCDIIVHKTINEKMVSQIEKSLKLHGADAIKKAIKNYMIVLNDSRYYFKTKWALIEFLKQSNALPDFLDAGTKWINYLEFVKTKGQKDRPKDKYEIENQDKDPMEGMEVL